MAFAEASGASFSLGSRARLTDRDLDRFPGSTLFDRVARAVCHAGCLPRKELYEAWEMGRRVRRLFRGGRIVDIAGGHGLLAQIMLILDDSSPAAIVVDRIRPPSSGRLQAALLQTWPRLSGRVEFLAADLETFDVLAADVVVSSHACGALTDRVLDRAVGARARVAVLPCCQHLSMADGSPKGGLAHGDLTGWIDGALAIDIIRAARLKDSGFRVWTQRIPAAVTPKNRLLLGAPE